jgi:hypothetical protein
MESFSDSDASSESDYESGQGSIPGSDCNEDELHGNFEPELSEPISEEYNNCPWTPQAQLNTTRLVQLYNNIKARVQLPIPTYLKVPWSWPARLFDIRILPSCIRTLLYYFELFWDS